MTNPELPMAMYPEPSNLLTRRRFVSSATLALGTLGLPACGGGGGASDAATGAVAAAPSPAPAPAPTPAPAPSPPPPPPAPAPGDRVASLKLHSAGAGAWPYAATVLLLQGQMPTGSTLVSPDDGALRASVLSRWQDGSAAVVVVAGNATVAANEDRTVRLQLARESVVEVTLGAARVAQLVSSVKIDFGSLGRVDVSDFSRPERIWWANAQTVCARYRASAPGHATLEAVIDIHAFAGAFALVEVVVENSKMSSGAPVKPADASYSAAVVTVNGVTAATVNGNGAPEGTHAAFRSWYASLWVGGNPNLRVTQAAAELQAHPLLWKMARAASGDMSVFAADTYTPWGAARQPSSNMGGTGDAASIGPVPRWEAQFLQTGDYRAANAVETSALAVLGFNINYRESTTGLPPTLAEVAGRNQQSDWPHSGSDSGPLSWEVAHHPAVGLMAFICRPTPVFIELAQKVAVWNGTWSRYQGVAGTTVFGGPYQNRGRAWCMRSLAHAAFLTPDGHAWKAPALKSIGENVDWLGKYMTDSKARLNCTWEDTPGILFDHRPALAGFQFAVWEHHYLTTELHKIASAQMLNGAAQTALSTLADWCALQPVRWVNEQPAGGWRFISYETTIGRDAATIDSASDWGTQRAFHTTDLPASVSGRLCSSLFDEPSRFSDYVPDGRGGAYYPSYWWAAFCAARERNVPGAATAWSIVQANVSDLSTWLDGFGNDPRWGPIPRNV